MNNPILAIDPGKHSGWAYFDFNKCLVACNKFDPEKTPFPVLYHAQLSTIGRPESFEVIIELPVGRGGRTNASVDSLIVLGMRAGIVRGACIERGLTVQLVETVKWSGTLSKCKTQKEHLGDGDVRHRRIAERLGWNERALLEGTKSSDVWDAVGLGLWACGRFGR